MHLKLDQYRADLCAGGFRIGARLGDSQSLLSLYGRQPAVREVKVKLAFMQWATLARLRPPRQRRPDRLSRRIGLLIEMTNANENDFIRNLLAIRAELRAALAVYAGNAFCEITGL
jgi:DNA-binding FadR family transcriptional regulator